MFEYLDDTRLGMEKHKLHKDISNLKFCNYIVSNGNCIPERKEFFNMLNAYKKVDSGGEIYE